MVAIALSGPPKEPPDKPNPPAEGGNVSNPTNTADDDMVKNASIVFVGTVEKVKAATLEEVEPNAETLVVKVDDVLHGTAAIRDYIGQAVTVQLTGPPAPEVGKKATFYVNSWLSGESLAVRGIARVGDAVAATQRKADQPLLDRLAAAQLVVVGKVTVVRPVPPPAVAAADAAINGGEGTRASEHDPDWHEAIIEVDGVPKGQLAAAGNKTVNVVFPASKDVLWYQAPKFSVGQDGTFLLHKAPANAAVAAMVKVRSSSHPDTYSAPHPNDVLPRAQAERVRALLQAP
jgi:hypothetical protein